MTNYDEIGARMFAFINEQFDAGRTVYVRTMTRTTAYKPKHREMFRLRGHLCQAQNGKRWDIINGCRIEAH